MNTNVTKISV